MKLYTREMCKSHEREQKGRKEAYFILPFDQSKCTHGGGENISI